MVDPTKITDFKRTQEELEEFLLFCVAVAGKTAKHISKALDKFLNDEWYYSLPIEVYQGYGDVGQEIVSLDSSASPFEKIKWLDKFSGLSLAIIDSKLGQHKKLIHVFKELANGALDLKTCSTQDLEKIKGIGPKTSRFFILHSRKTNDIACLDTHQLKYMREIGIDAPKVIPSKKKYQELERLYLNHLKDIGIEDVAEFDLKIWNKFSTRSGSG